VLNFAPTGMVPRRRDSPHVPLEPDAIADQINEAASLGITVAHLHARDEGGEPTHAADVYARIIERVRASHPSLVICVSLSGRVRGDFESRSAPLTLTGRLKPDMASLTPASMNFTREASVSAPEMVARLAEEMLRRGVLPEVEVFDTGMMNYSRLLASRGLLRPPFYFNLMLGNAATAQADPLSLGAILAMMPEPSLWAAGGIGRTQSAAHALALGAGGGVRTGLEDNLFADWERTTLATNLQLVRRARDLGAALDRPVMTPQAFRQRMALAAGCDTYGRAPIDPSAGAPT